jgi:hypothetical protein
MARDRLGLVIHNDEREQQPFDLVLTTGRHRERAARDLEDELVPRLLQLGLGV